MAMDQPPIDRLSAIWSVSAKFDFVLYFFAINRRLCPVGENHNATMKSLQRALEGVEIFKHIHGYEEI